MEQPEQYFIEPTPFVPGSHLPVLVYRGAVANCENEDDIKAQLEENGGWKKGGAWNAFFKAHYHPNVHECYGVAKGWSELSLGRAPQDDSTKGKLLRVNQGDVVIIPAGVSHCSSTASPDYRFVVLFPTGEPKWVSIWCKTPDADTYKKECLRVPLPTIDPLEGPDGYLVKTWREVAARSG